MQILKTKLDQFKPVRRWSQGVIHKTTYLDMGKCPKKKASSL
jgi:hypothetical protein